MIYFVDDDQNVRDSIEVASPDSWDLKVFADPKDALDSIEKDKPFLVITDVMMDSMIGTEFIEVAERFLPSCQFVIVSASTIKRIEEDFGRKIDRAFFQKPLGQAFFDYVNNIVESPTSKEASLEANAARKNLEDLVALKGALKELTQANQLLEEFDLTTKKSLLSITNIIHNALVYGKKDELGRTKIIVEKCEEGVVLTFDALSNIAEPYRAKTISLPLPKGDYTAQGKINNSFIVADSVCTKHIDEIYINHENQSTVTRELSGLRKASRRSGKGFEYYTRFLPQKISKDLDWYLSKIDESEEKSRLDAELLSIYEAIVMKEPIGDIQNSLLSALSGDTSRILEWIDELPDSECKTSLLTWISDITLKDLDKG